MEQNFPVSSFLLPLSKFPQTATPEGGNRREYLLQEGTLPKALQFLHMGVPHVMDRYWGPIPYRTPTREHGPALHGPWACPAVGRLNHTLSSKRS